MSRAHLADAVYRHIEWGPAYLLRGPNSDIGECKLRPGDEFANHYHAQTEETFVVLEGSATLWVDCRHRFTLGFGDVHRCMPGEMHYFVNETEQPFRALFVKAPHNPQDTITVEWYPGDSVPERADLVSG